jgi:hypothetical protein
MKVDVRKIINWAEVSRLLSGDRHAVRSDYVVKEHRNAVNALLDKAQEWCDDNIKSKKSKHTTCSK